MMRARLPALAAATGLVLSGCSLAPHYTRPDLPVPPSWPTGDAYLKQSEAALPAMNYRQVFTDPRLQAVIERALANNQDLKTAAANIVAARAQYRIQRADLFPEVDAQGRYSRTGGGNGAGVVGSSSGGGGNGGTGTTGTGSGTTGTGSGTAGGTTGTGNTGAGATGSTGASSGTVVTSSSTGTAFSATIGTTAFEVDLFGRVRSLTTAALDRYFATEAAARATRLTLVGDVATAWLQLAADRSLLTVAANTIKSSQVSVNITRARLDGGIAPRTDLDQALQVLETAQADFAQQTTLVAQDGNYLQLLVGAPIEGALLPQSIDEAAPTVKPLPAGLDSSVLLRRPDVVEAEYQLRAANAEIGAARAELFPKLSLTGLAGFASSALSTLFTGGAFSYSVAPSLTYPIFRAGAARAGVRYSQAERDAAVAAYKKAIQSAFRDTADALARAGTIEAQFAAQQRFAAAAQDTLVLTNAQYQAGVTEFLSSLDAERQLYTAQRTLVTTLQTAAANRVNLYVALGGDATLDAPPRGGPVVPTGAAGSTKP